MDHPPTQCMFLRVDVQCECHPDWIGPYIIHSELPLGDSLISPNDT